MKCAWIVAVLLLAFAAPAHAVTTGVIREVTIEQLQKGCEAREFGDCDLLGKRYLAGNDVPQDAKKAASLFARACEGGDAEGCRELAVSYRFGEGVAKDDTKATAYYKRSCDRGSAISCAWVADAYNEGIGVKQNYAIAALYADRSCKGSSHLGCGMLGVAYLYGAGPEYPKDLARAKELLTTACLDGARFYSEPDSAALYSCPRLTKLTGEQACATSYGNLRYCYEQGAWQRVAAAASPAAALPPQTARVAPSNTSGVNPTQKPRVPNDAVAQFDDLIATDAASWAFNRYDRGSMSDMRVVEEKGNTRTVYGNYTYNKGASGWVKARFVGNKLECLEYWDFSGQCRPLGRSPGQGLASGFMGSLVTGLATGMMKEPFLGNSGGSSGSDCNSACQDEREFYQNQQREATYREYHPEK